MCVDFELERLGLLQSFQWLLVDFKPGTFLNV